MAAQIQSGERCDPSAGSARDPVAPSWCRFWRLPGMPADSGSPTDWLDAPSHHVVNVHCRCELEVAASRFLQRRRHPGHLDGESSSADVLASLRQLTQLPSLDIGFRIDVDTSQEPNLPDVVRAIHGALGPLTLTRRDRACRGVRGSKPPQTAPRASARAPATRTGIGAAASGAARERACRGVRGAKPLG